MVALNNNHKRIYRLEYEDSRGMYCRLGKRGWKGAAHKVMKENKEQHPNPFGDMKLMTGLVKHNVLLENCYFGFCSIPTLRAWVNSDAWLLGLHSLGVKLAVYTCDEGTIIHGEKQSLFYESIRKRQYDLKKYFSL